MLVALRVGGGHTLHLLRVARTLDCRLELLDEFRVRADTRVVCRRATG